MQIPKITGPDVLQAASEKMKGKPAGSFLTISPDDSHDLFKLTQEDLADQFGFDSDVAAKVEDELQRGNLSELSKAIGVNLIVDRNHTTSLIKNAGIIRSAGALMDDPESLDDMLKFLHDLRHHQGR